jgi:hypothetical protein
MKNQLANDATIKIAPIMQSKIPVASINLVSLSTKSKPKDIIKCPP